MVGETTMNLLSGSTPEPPNGVAKDVSELTHDIMSLAELQFELFKSDCRNGLKGLLIPVVLLLFATIVAVGTVPLALICIAEVLVQAAGLSRAAALSITGIGGVIAAVALGIVGWSQVRGVGRVFARSREELTHNLAWIKHALKRPAPVKSQQPQNR